MNPSAVPRRLLSICLPLLLAACASAPAPTAAPAADYSAWSACPDHGVWQPHKLPGKALTEYRAVRRAGANGYVLQAQAHASASMLRRPLAVNADQLGRLRYSWQVPALIANADLTQRETEDSPVRIVLAFDGDHDRLSMRNQSLFDLAQLVTGERPPYATLMYVWENRAARESVIINPRTDRIRKIVAESGPARLGQWLSYERDIAADFRRAFGEEPGRLIGVAVMTDSDNTGSDASALYGELTLLSARGERL